MSLNEATCLSARKNIVVIADEAHRSQYGFGGRINDVGEMMYGFASNLRDALPSASFIGFTGTPIEKADANTRNVFGDYISIYDIQRAVADPSHGTDLLRKPHFQTRFECFRAAKARC